jgi:rhodanese-related sulfurtransferase
VEDLVAAAEREIETLPLAEALRLHGRDDVVFVDLRDIRELDRDGRMPGAFHCPRGMLEFWIDPQSKYYKPVFGQDKRYVFFCAAAARSALAAQTASRMGLKPVAHMQGGFSAWKAAGGPVATGERRKT